MNEEAIYAQLNEVFRGFLGDATIALHAGTVAADVPGWDSMNHVQLMIKVEEAFSVRFKHAEIAAFENVGDLVAALLKRKGAAA